MDQDVILEFDAVTIPSYGLYEMGLSDFSCSVNRGDFIAAWMDRGHAHVPLADAAQGLIDPEEGAVRIQGEDWRSLSGTKGAEYRGRTGRVFEEHGWISNLDADENITLSERHHTLRAEAEIRREADALARRFELDGVPASRMNALKRADRRRVEWIRAFIGKPLLVLLEHPMRNVFAHLADSLLEEVRTARAQGTGVIWLTSDPVVWSKISSKANCKLKQKGSNLTRVEGE